MNGQAVEDAGRITPLGTIYDDVVESRLDAASADTLRTRIRQVLPLVTEAATLLSLAEDVTLNAIGESREKGADAAGLAFSRVKSLVEAAVARIAS